MVKEIHEKLENILMNNCECTIYPNLWDTDKEEMIIGLHIYLRNKEKSFSNQWSTFVPQEPRKGWANKIQSK